MNKLLITNGRVSVVNQLAEDPKLAVAEDQKGLFPLALQGTVLPGCFARIALIYVSLLLLTTGSQAADKDTHTPDHVAELIRRLDAKTLVDRSHAERELLELGPAVLPLLPTAEAIESASARDALRRIRPKLERQAARESSAPFPITARGEPTVNEIVAQIRTQSRNQIVLSDDAAEQGRQTLKLEWSQSHFWACVDELCQRSSLEWQFAKDAPQLRLTRATETSPRDLAVQRIGSFRMAIQSIETRSIVGDERHKIIRVAGKLAVEPRLRPLFLSMSTENLDATANDNRPLATWNPGAKYEFPISDGGHEVPLQWDFKVPEFAELKTLAISGRLDCQIAAATERIVFDSTSQARGVIRRRGGVAVRIREVNLPAADNDGVDAEIGITVSYDNGGPAFESHRSWIFHNAVYLETKDGLRTPYTDFDISQQSDGAVAVDYRWRKIPKLGEKYLFVYEAPTLIVDVPITIDMLNIRVKP